MNNIIGIDPGAHGAMAVFKAGGGIIVSPFSPEKYRSLINAFALSGGVVAYVEDVHSMPKQGVASCFSFGRNLGFILGLLFAFGARVEMVSPQKWKNYYGLKFGKGTDKKDIKNASIDAALKLFPSISLRATDRCKKDNDGMAEALLIAKYGLAMEEKKLDERGKK